MCVCVRGGGCCMGAGVSRQYGTVVGQCSIDVLLPSPLLSSPPPPLFPSPPLPQRLNSLLVTQDLCDWRVHHCYGCDSSTHVTHKVTGSRVLITAEMEHRSEELSSLEQRKEYSPVFKVILRDGPEDEGEEEPSFRKRGGWDVGRTVCVMLYV